MGLNLISLASDPRESLQLNFRALMTAFGIGIREKRYTQAPSHKCTMFLPRIYLQGCTEATHGLSESLLSILGVRAGLVVDDILS